MIQRAYFSWMLRGAFILLIWLGLPGMAADAAFSSLTGGPDTPATTLSCGPNSLLTFLILAGRSSTTMDEVGSIRFGPNGASLLSLRNAAKRLGVEAEVRHYRAEDIDSVPLPAVVQFTNDLNDTLQSHFIVIYKVDREHFYLIDGTTGFHNVGRKPRLSDFWTGYALVPKRRFGMIPRRLSEMMNLILLVLVLECSVITLHAVRSLNHKRRERQLQKLLSKATMMLFSAFLLPIQDLVPNALGATPQTWRCAANGGINVLYCYLLSADVRCSYAELLEDQAAASGSGVYSVSTLSHLADTHGVRLRAVWLNMDELRSCPKPLIVHMDGETPQMGAFLLLIKLTSHNVLYMNGPSATVHEMPLETFCRAWSGAALVRTTKPLNEVSACIAFFVLGVSLPKIVQCKWHRNLQFI